MSMALNLISRGAELKRLRKIHKEFHDLVELAQRKRCVEEVAGTLLYICTISSNSLLLHAHLYMHPPPTHTCTHHPLTHAPTTYSHMHPPPTHTQKRTHAHTHTHTHFFPLRGHKSGSILLDLILHKTYNFYTKSNKKTGYTLIT